MHEKIIWTEEYSVNVAEIDEQHKDLFKICDDLLNFADKSPTRQDALVEIMKLGDYASYHLGTEEELFKQTQYPDAGSHLVVHNQFREKAKDLINSVRDEKNDSKKIISETAMFVIKWLMSHILIMDKKYSEFFNEHGIK
jgi:hemerythrin-like metal-binding protein